jgi:hypothetical protein
MTKFEKRGQEVRETAKSLVLDFMRAESLCAKDGAGMRQAEIFRACGFDFGDRSSSPSTQQQYWLVALLRELESEACVVRVRPGGPWRLC